MEKGHSYKHTVRFAKSSHQLPGGLWGKSLSENQTNVSDSMMEMVNKRGLPD